MAEMELMSEMEVLKMLPPGPMVTKGTRSKAMRRALRKLMGSRTSRRQSTKAHRKGGTGHRPRPKALLNDIACREGW